MTGPKRTAAQREEAIEKVARFFCRGMPQHQMAQELGVSRQQVYYDLEEMHARWQKHYLADVDRAKSQQLARIDHLEAVAWEAWDRSCQPVEITSAAIISGRVDKDGKPLPDLKKTARVVRSQVGNPAFLERVAWCIAQRCRILGLYPKLPPAPFDQSQHLHVTITDEERAEYLRDLRSRAQALRTETAGSGDSPGGSGGPGRPPALPGPVPG